MEEKILYSDKLVVIKETGILLRNFYFPTFSDKNIMFSEIEKIEIVKPTLISGKFRYWGTGDFLHWFPLDIKRNKRDAIFILYRKSKGMNIGFTVENSDEVIEIFKQKVDIKNVTSV